MNVSKVSAKLAETVNRDAKVGRARFVSSKRLFEDLACAQSATKPSIHGHLGAFLLQKVSQ
jgi:hypothetical protein